MVTLLTLIYIIKYTLIYIIKGNIFEALWLSGRVLDSELKGPKFKSHHGPEVVSLGKRHYSHFFSPHSCVEGVSGRIMMVNLSVFNIKSLTDSLLVILAWKWRCFILIQDCKLPP